MKVASPLIQSGDDLELQQVIQFFSNISGLTTIFSRLLRQAFDEVIDGPRTGRFCIEQLEKTEKTYIGTKVEIIIRSELGMNRGVDLDNSIFGIDVDTKFSLTANWMIPREAQNKICLLVAGNDIDGSFKVGLLRMTPDVLTQRPNRDGKLSVSSFGKQSIHWISIGSMPPNFLLGLQVDIRNEILSQPSGLQRVHALFKAVNGRLIPRKVIEQVARQKDPMRRARQMRDIMRGEGYLVLCATYDAEVMRSYGYETFDKNDWLVLKVRF